MTRPPPNGKRTGPPLEKSAPPRPATTQEQQRTVTRITDGAPSGVIPLAALRSRRVERVTTQAGPWWGGTCMHTWSMADASRTRWSA